LEREKARLEKDLIEVTDRLTQALERQKNRFEADLRDKQNELERENKRLVGIIETRNNKIGQVEAENRDWERK